MLVLNGVLQSEVSLQDFEDAEPDILLHSTAEIVERFREKGIRCNVALKALCKKKGLHVQVVLLHCDVLQLFFCYTLMVTKTFLSKLIH